jgi:enterobacterial common antigen flippase
LRTPARILIVGAVALSTGRALAGVLKGVGRPLDAGLADGAALVVTAVGLAVLLPAFGLVGAAAASVLAYTASAALMLRLAARALDLPVWALVLPGQADRGAHARTAPEAA